MSTRAENRILIVEFDNGARNGMVIARQGKTRPEFGAGALRFAVSNRASQAYAVRKALTDAGYRLTK
jgi:hypothetical protein